MPLKLSICVPSRNRQVYFQETIRALTRSARSDVEFVFADNSDDAAVMNDFMHSLIDDPRIVYLPSTGRVLPMIDNWERTVAAATGDWVTVIGDDDYCDPELAGFLQRLVAAHPEADALDWTSLHYVWPTGEGSHNLNIALPATNTLFQVSQSRAFRRAWQWEGATHTLDSGFSIYHSAVSRRLLETIRQRFSGRYFEYPTVDIESALKVALAGQHLMFCNRPFSVMGVCPLSNSASLHSQTLMRQRNEDFMRELGRNLDDDPEMADFPFPSSFGVVATIGQVHHWLKKTHRLKVENWETAFVQCCQRSCEVISERDFFDDSVAHYRAALKVWKGGRYAPLFNPVFVEDAAESEGADAFSGHSKGHVYVSLKLLDPRTPAELFDVLAGIFTVADDIPLVSHVLY